MGSKTSWVTVEEASKRLGCPIAMVEELYETGMLRRLKSGGTVMVHAADVEEVNSLKGGIKMGADEMRQRILILEKTVERIRSALDMLLVANKLESTKLDPMDDESLVNLYDAIEAECKATEWPITRILSCCEIYLRLSEDDLERLDTLLGIRSPWTPFYRLCLAQLRYVTGHPKFDTSLDLQRCKDILARGRANLRQLACISIFLKGGKGSSYKLLADLAAVDIDAFDVLVKQMERQNGRFKFHAL